MEPAPVPSSENARLRMVAQARHNTSPEKVLRSELHRRGRRFRLHRRPVDGLRREADLVFTRQRVAVFVDGCFWHQCPRHGTIPKSNSEWWRRKFERTRARDSDTDRQLEEAGWKVIRIWEHEAISAAADLIERVLNDSNRGVRRQAYESEA